MQPLGLETVRKQAATMEIESRRFYESAAKRAQDPGTRQLLDDLANEDPALRLGAQPASLDLRVEGGAFVCLLLC